MSKKQDPWDSYTDFMGLNGIWDHPSDVNVGLVSAHEYYRIVELCPAP